MLKKTWRVWLVGLVGLAAGLWWMLQVPYRPERLYRGLPAHTAFVGIHRDLAGRWPAISQNPLTQSLFQSLGIEPDELRALAEDPASRRWLESLASDEVLVAYVPELGQRNEPAWLVFGWLGGQSQRLRWQLAWARVPGFVPHPPYRGWRSWTIEEAGQEADTELTVALVEGMALGVFSRDPTALHEVLDVFDGLQPNLTVRPDFPASGIWCRDPKAPDRGWLNLAALGAQSEQAPPSLTYEWNDLQPAVISGTICGADPFKVEFARYPQLKTTGLDKLFGNVPQGLALLSPALVLPQMEDPASPGWFRLFGELLRQEKAGVVALAILGGDFSGRLKGIKLPTLVAGIPVEEEGRALAWMKDALDRLNARYRWGLVPRESPAGQGKMTIIEGTSTNFLSALLPQESPAYAVRGGWFLLGSNAEGLGKLLAAQEATAAATTSRPRWAIDLPDQPAPAYVWLDLLKAGQTIRLALSTWSLKLLIEDPRGTLETRQRLNEARAWVDSLMPMETARFWLRSDGSVMEINFKAGR